MSPLTRTGDEPALRVFVVAAQAGDRHALERVVCAVQDDVYRLSLRMTGCPEDAHDAAQEVLIKVVTRLASFRAESSVRTWAYRIAVHHLLDRKKSRVEALALDFDRFGADLLDGLAAPDTTDPVAVEEVKLGCTLAMLTCLDRDHRIAYVLGDVFELPAADAAHLCGIGEPAHRQRLSRARRQMEAFTRSYCGLVDARAPCRCDRRVTRAIELGRIERGRPRLAAGLDRALLERAVTAMESLHTAARLLRSHPDYTAPATLLAGVQKALLRDGARLLDEPTDPPAPS